MGLFEAPDMYEPCPECGADAIEEEGKVFVKRVFCDECGYEPERSDVLKSAGQIMEDSKNQESGSTDQTAHICRECHEEISPDVERCPHCGWKPKKRGGLWWGTTALMSFNPIGWVMGAKGASDSYKASKGVAKEAAVTPDESPGKTEEQTAKRDPAERLERLSKLKEDGIITEDDFEEKKEELLEEM